jgi:gliding motility-associated protein GldM
MSLPKEPRQKMINMMYLVLTALLALNVSAEILNAFKIVDTSLQSSNKNITAANDIMYKDLTAKLSDPQVMANAKIWQPVAMEVQKLSKEMYDAIEAYKVSLKNEAGAKNGDSTFKVDDLDAGVRLFINKGEGKKLYDKLAAYRKALLALGPDKEIENNFKQFLSLEQPKQNEKDWTYTNFHMVPTVAGLTILTKLQADVKNSENQIVTYCESKLGQVKVKFDTYATIVGQNTEYTMPGGQITIRGGVGAFSKSSQPKVSIGGVSANLTPDGFAEATIPAGGVGPHSAMVSVTYTTQDGQTKTEQKEVKWVVGQPGTSSVSADLMNALYIGVPNPITVGSSSGWDKTTVSFGDLSASKTGEGKFTVTPGGSPRNINITVTSDKNTSSFPYRVLFLPPATAYIGGKKDGGTISSAFLKAQGGIVATLENTPFNATYYITSYKVWVNGKNGYQEAQNIGNRWSGAAAALINGAAPGAAVGFENIKAKGPDGRDINVANPNIVFGKLL